MLLGFLGFVVTTAIKQENKWPEGVYIWHTNVQATTKMKVKLKDYPISLIVWLNIFMFDIWL